LSEAVPIPAGATLLVVDDNEMNRDMLSRRLEKRGYRVLTADDGQPALDLLEREPVDLVLLDIMMPGLDGIEVLKTVRAKHSAAELPVIMTTAKGDSRDVVEALDLGANDYVTKPIDFAVVLARVQKELRTRGVRSAAITASGGAAGSAGGAAGQKPISEFGPGAVIEGKYRLEVKLGAGNFGAVYRASHVDLGRAVAVKILQTRVEENEAALERFRSEGRAACLVRHPNAVSVHDFGVTSHGTAYLVMELLEGKSLADELKAGGRLSPQRVSRVLPAICAVLSQAHQAGIVHRDIKPENVFSHREIDQETIKVLDFGIAKLVGDHVSNQNLTAEGFILGTPAYMAPERLKNLPYDGRADVYSLGCMLYQLLTAKLPFPGKPGEPMAMLLMHLNEPPPSVRALVPDLPISVDRLVIRCMAKDPAERPAIDELAGLFAAASKEEPPRKVRRAFVDGDAPTHEMGTAKAPVDAHALTTRTELPPSPPAPATARPAAAPAAFQSTAATLPPSAPTAASPALSSPSPASPAAAPPGKTTQPTTDAAAPPASLSPQISTSWMRSILDRVFGNGSGGSGNKS
jgi:serine/threonine protein kinase/CheY-like chemotaxis protein